ncbi:MAG: class I SAM-dependent methyltransferase [bacterium]
MSKAHRDYFNTLAPEWNDRMADDPELRDYLIRFDVSAGDRVLDIGAGTGRMTKYLCELVGNDGTVVTEDFAVRMLEEGKRSLHSDKLMRLCDDATALALKRDCFDKVLCFSVFPHFSDPKQVLQEFHRVLRPGGKLLILHTCSSHELNHFHASLNGIVCDDRLLSAEEMLPLLHRSGFRSEQVVERDNLYWVQAFKPCHKLDSTSEVESNSVNVYF